jgi:arginase family enzyme
MQEWKAIQASASSPSPTIRSTTAYGWGLARIILEPSEQRRLAAYDIAVISADLIEEEGLGVLARALDGLRARPGRVYMHLDLDVLDPVKAGRANEFAPEAGGLNSEDLEMALGPVRERFIVAATGVASYDPALDVDGSVLHAALAGVRALVPSAGRGT